MMYAQNAVAVNEFLGNKWKHVGKNVSIHGMKMSKPSKRKENHEQTCH